MLTISQFSRAKKEITSPTFAKWNFSSPSWADFTKPTAQELEALAVKTNIPLSILKESTHPHQRANVTVLDKYVQFVFIASVKHEDSYTTTPLVMFLNKETLITIHEKPLPSFEQVYTLLKNHKEPLFERGMPSVAVHICSALTENFFSSLEDLNSKIDHVEQEVIENPGNVHPRHIFKFKRTLLLYQRSLFPNKDAVVALGSTTTLRFSPEDRREISDLANDLNELLYLVSTYQDILTNVLDMYLSSVSNNMNKIMKTLTIITAFVMIPTFIGSIYGMNFQQTSPWNMPELYWQYGYLFALGLMAVSVFITYLVFKKKKWL